MTFKNSIRGNFFMQGTSY